VLVVVVAVGCVAGVSCLCCGCCVWGMEFGIQRLSLSRSSFFNRQAKILLLEIGADPVPDVLPCCVKLLEVCMECNCMEYVDDLVEVLRPRAPMLGIANFMRYCATQLEQYQPDQRLIVEEVEKVDADQCSLP